MPKDLAATLEATTDKLIRRLLEKKQTIEDQLQRLRHKEQKLQP